MYFSSMILERNKAGIRGGGISIENGLCFQETEIHIEDSILDNNVAGTKLKKKNKYLNEIIIS
jgi:hypothetical protein